MYVKSLSPGDNLSENCHHTASAFSFCRTNVCFSKSERKSRSVNTNSRFNPVSKTLGIPAPTTDDVLAASLSFTFVPNECRSDKKKERGKYSLFRARKYYFRYAA